jgi:hypothetical protein
MKAQAVLVDGAADLAAVLADALQALLLVADNFE